MPSPVVQILLIFCLIYSYAFGARVQLHPRLETKDLPISGYKEEPGYLTSSMFSPFWVPGRATAFFMKMQHQFGSISLTIAIKIVDLSPKEKIYMRLRYKCSSNDPEDVKELSLPFDKDHVLICSSTLPLSIDKESAKWVSSTSYALTFQINTKRGTNVPFSYALTHYIRLQVDFWGTHWSLSSNGLFIRNWDALLRLNENAKGKKFQRRYLTEDAVDLMQGMKFNKYSGFRTEQFFDPDLVAIIASASEFVQSTIGIGAKLIIGKTGRCQPGPYGLFGHSDREIWFMSSQFYELWNRPGMRVLRIDTATGKITYSPYGLGEVASRVELGYLNQKKCPDGSGRFCPYITVCRWTEYTPVRGVPPFVNYDFAGYTPGNLGPNYSDRLKGVPVPPEECILLASNPSRVTVFARVDERTVVCPIICTREAVEFRFYKEDFPLYPMKDNNPINSITTLGAISVHRSGAVLIFSEYVTDKDAGRYRCTAGGKEATILVNIVSLPLFHIPDTAWSGGHLPRITYARIGRGYSLTCTVFHSGMRSVTIAPEFYMVVDKRKLVWTKLSGEEFARRLTLFDSKATISISRTEYSTSLSLQVSVVPHPTDVFDFSHRFVCNVSVSKEDAQRFGVSEYSLQSGTQVVVVPPPTNKDIESKMSPCCVEGCFGKNCVIEFVLSSELQDRLKSIGLEAHGTFKVGNKTINDETKKQVTYDKNGGKLRIETDKPIAEMTDAERKMLTQMVPVFEYVVKDSELNASISCEQNPLCVVSTDDSDKSVRDSLRTGAKFKELNSIAAATGKTRTKTGISKDDNITVYKIMNEILDASNNAATTGVSLCHLVTALAAIVTAHLLA